MITPQLLTSLTRAVRLGVSATARETAALFHELRRLMDLEEMFERYREEMITSALEWGRKNGRLERENAQLRAKVDELTDALTVERATRQLDEMAVAA